MKFSPRTLKGKVFLNIKHRELMLQKEMNKFSYIQIMNFFFSSKVTKNNSYLEHTELLLTVRKIHMQNIQNFYLQ